MDSEKVIQDLNRRFAAPLPEFYKRRIIFWYDEEKEFEDQIDDIALNYAKIIKLTGTNNFMVKKLLCVDDTVSNYLVYRPYSIDNDDNDWLLNVELYSEEFRSDLISIWMDEMHIQSTTILRQEIKKYRKFFNARDRRAKVAKMSLTKKLSTANDIRMAVMSSICRISSFNSSDIIKAVLCGGIDNDTNEVYGELVHFGADESFWDMVLKETGYGEAEPLLSKLSAHILLTASTRTMDEDYLRGLEIYISSPNLSFCYDLVSDWMHSDDNMKLYDIAESVEDELHLPQRFEKLPVHALLDTECFPCINECILSKKMKEISDDLIDVDSIYAIVEKRRTCVWYKPLHYYFDGLLQVANMQKFFKEHSENFHTVNPKEVWERYTKSYYKMDTYYRLYHASFSESLKSSNPVLDDLFKHVTDAVERIYKNWFLEKLASNWTNACADELRDYGHVLEVKQQSEFYKCRVRDCDSRLYVIISDGLRYEVGATLSEQLRRETQAQVKLDSMQAIFPAVTEFGMAALLPHKELSVEKRNNNKLAVLADGSFTDSNYREKILKSADENNAVLMYDDLIKMKRAERKSAVKDKDVVYIYHDKIDKAGHSSDEAVFSACSEAIEEIKNLVRIIANDLSGTNIIITSDHGFLYTYNPLKESDKVDRTSFENKDVVYGRRYAILEKDAAPENLMPVKFMEGRSEYMGYAPKDNIRIKMNGGGLNYVHGGVSLQEMVVPVIEYHYLRNSSAEYQKNKNRYDLKPVTLSLFSSNKKICNMIFGLNFYQKEPVSDNREAATYKLFFVDKHGNQISDTQTIIADRTSDNANERTFRRNFNLRQQEYKNTEVYYLEIVQENGFEAPVREEFQIDIAFSLDFD